MESMTLRTAFSMRKQSAISAASEHAVLGEQLRSLPADWVVVDLATGTSSATLDLFLEADIGLRQCQRSRDTRRYGKHRTGFFCLRKVLRPRERAGTDDGVAAQILGNCADHI